MRLVGSLLVLMGLGFGSLVNNSAVPTSRPELILDSLKKKLGAKRYKLVWSDEFNYKGLPDKSKWNFDVGGDGWGNNELQYYTEKDTSNALVGNGILKITARKQAKGNRQYTSARLTTKDKAEFTYGKIEVRAKLPAGRGTWPAIWMLGGNINKVGWPACGEIDIMEHVGFNKDSLFSSIHTTSYNHIKGTQKTKGIYIASPYTRFHTYAMEWTPDKIDFLLDGVSYFVFHNEHLTTKEWPFNAPQFLLLNVAIGGFWGGQKGIDELVFPATMEIDYVRVYQKTGS